MTTAARKLSATETGPAALPVRLIKAGADRRAEPAIPPGAPRVRLAGPLPTPTAECVSEHPLTLIGSRRDCHLSIAHGEVSQIHLALVNTGRHLLVCDLRSRTGTFINNQRIDVGVLRPGDTLRAGPVGIQCDFQMPPLDSDIENAARLPFAIMLRGTTQACEITQNAAVIGRRHNCHVVLDTPDVSLAHAVLFTLNGKPLLYDLGSRSGTIVNGERVSCAWLATGDRIHIGGEELVVSWEGCADSVAAPAAAEAAPAAQAMAEPRGSSSDSDLVSGKDGSVDTRDTLPMPSAPDIEGLEAMISALHSQVSASRAKLAERAKQLDERELELMTREQELVDARAALDLQTAELATREQKTSDAQAELEGARKQLEEARKQLDEARQKFEVDKAAIEKSRSEIEAARAQIAQSEQALKTKQAGLDQKLAAQQQAQAELEKREQALKLQATQLQERSAGVDAREQALADREKQLHDREAAEAATSRKIAVLKSALEQATSAFADIDEPASAESSKPAAAAPRAKPQEPARVDARKPDAHKPNGAAAKPTPNGGAKHAAPVGPTNLPAPIVDQPVFNAASAAPTSAMDEWPPEWRERMRVLRRLASNKSEQELMEQVVAEFKAKGQTAGPSQQDSKKRRWWS